VPLISQAEYARRRNISRVAVHLRTTTKGGPIPVHGTKKLIDPAEADALWEATMSPAGAAGARGALDAKRRVPEEPSSVVTGTTLTQARAAALVVDVQTKRLVLEQRRGALISRDRALLKTFAFARTVRDHCQTWAGRIGPQLAAAFEIDATAVTVVLEDHVRQLLSELASERVDF
jgi:hypothetical protein